MLSWKTTVPLEGRFVLRHSVARQRSRKFLLLDQGRLAQLHAQGDAIYAPAINVDDVGNRVPGIGDYRWGWNDGRRVIRRMGCDALRGTLHAGLGPS